MSILFDEENDSFTENSDDNKDNNSSLNKDNSIELSIYLIINELIKRTKNLSNYKKILSKQNRDIFTLKKIPKINLLQYLDRVTKYLQIERSTLIIGLIYFDRIILNNCIYVTEYNVHQLILISLIISYKNNEDITFENDYLSEIGGIKLKFFTQLEIKYLELIDYNLFVSIDEFLKYKNLLKNYCFKYNCL